MEENPDTDRTAASSEYNINTEYCDCPQQNPVPSESDITKNGESQPEIPITNQDNLQTVTDTVSVYPNPPIPEIPTDIHKRIRKSIFDYSQTQNSVPKPPPRPRKRYDDEGKWKIIRQDENKKETNYEYL